MGLDLPRRCLSSFLFNLNWPKAQLFLHPTLTATICDTTTKLRHLRYFIAVAEEGSLTNAAEKRLHTAQPSLSRQIKDLEIELGVKLLERKARGISLTPAGKVFLDHARLALMQIEAAAEAARQAEQPKEPAFVVGFLIGQEVTWLPHTLRILREEAPDVDIMIFSRTSP